MTALRIFDMELNIFSRTSGENHDGVALDHCIRQNLRSRVSEGIISDGEVGHKDFGLMTIEDNGATMLRDCDITNRGAHMKLEGLLGR